MKKIIYLSIAAISVLLAAGAYKIQRSPPVNTQAFSPEAADGSSMPFEQLARARVTAVLLTGGQQNKYLSRISQTLSAVLESGPEKGKQVTVDYEDTLTDKKLQEARAGDIIVVGKIPNPDEYVLVDRYRLNYLAWAFAAFLCAALVFGRARGLTSLLGLASSIMVLVYFVVPNVLDGKNPELVSLAGAGIICLVSMFLAHGFKYRTAIAVAATLTAILLSTALAQIFLSYAKLLGDASEQAFYLQAGYFGSINLQGLFLGGIIIACLGVLNDITTAQAAAVEEIHKADPALGFKELYKKGSAVGREHIASLINTLVLAYAGASLPLFLLFTVNTGPLWTIINSSTIAEELARSLVGGAALIIAMPLATALAAYCFSEK